jgi:hypothetical protein
MKTENLVNGYVLANLFYELIFVDEQGAAGSTAEWASQPFVDDVIHRFVVPRFESFTPETKTVVRNTLRYLLATKEGTSDTWEVIWQASSAPIPTPAGVRAFVNRCHDILFQGEPSPSSEEAAKYLVSHDMHVASMLN